LGVIFDQESEEETEGTENQVTPEQVVHKSDQRTRQRGVQDCNIRESCNVDKAYLLEGKVTGVTVSVLFTNHITKHLTK
jgi:hypothetical protein